MSINEKLISTDKDEEGVYHQSVTGAIYIFYKQKGGNKVRLDVYEGKKINEVDEFKDYNITSCSDTYDNKNQITTYYLSPKQKYYTDTTGSTYKTTSICVYIDQNGDYRSFSDDTKKDIDRMIKQLEIEKKRLNKCLNSSYTNYEKDIERHNKFISYYEKMIDKYKKQLSKGF